MIDKKYQIFISSTLTDLLKARDTIIKAILNLYHVPIGMEMFSADNKDQWDTIKATIDFSDYYVLIIGHRYGSLSSEGISYTEKEFNYAKETGVPVLAFIRNRDISTKESERETEHSKQKQLDLFIKKVSSNAMVDYWEDEKDLANKVIIALIKIFAKSPRTGWIRSDKGMSPDTANELALLSKENRLLKDELQGIKDKIALRKPLFEIFINGAKNITENYIEDETLIKDAANYIKPISYISGDLSPYINDSELKRYNSIVNENGSEIIEYNKEVLNFERRLKTNKSYTVIVKNIGTAKATNVVVDIEFPKEVIFLEQNSIRTSFKLLPQRF